MKTVMKNLLLGSVAGLAMVGTAAAADLPVKAKAAEYVKVCSTYGAGFYYIPGTDTCLKVGGYITADFYVQSYDFDVNGRQVGSLNSDTESFFLTRGAVQLDARTQTEYGTVRAYFEGRFEYGSSYGVVDNDAGNLGFSLGNDFSDVYLKYGYIQFAGFTFGKATSAFDFYAGDFYVGILPGGFYSDVTTNLISYTADFGNGFSATISVEDGYNRDGGNSYAWYDDGFFEPQQVPDIVANVAYEGAWGSAKVAAAFHDLRAYDGLWYVPGGNGYYSADDYGWAVLAGVKFNFAETTTLYVEGAYADGALGYLGISSFAPNVDSFGDSVSGWYVASALRHYWTPTVFTSLIGNYAQTDDFATFDGYGTTSLEAWNVAANIGWVPVKGLTLALQYDYTEVKYDSAWTGENWVDASYNQSRFTFSASRAF